jgi:hypothetical protein
MVSKAQSDAPGDPLLANRPHIFKHRDIVRGIKAVQSAGLTPESVTVDLGKRCFTVNCKADGSDAAPMRNPWDEVLSDAADQKRPA